MGGRCAGAVLNRADRVFEREPLRLKNMRRWTLTITHDCGQNNCAVNLMPASTLRRGGRCFQNTPQGG
jgi:hypothetical protein